MAFEYRNIDPLRDQIITDMATGAVVGVRNEQGQSAMIIPAGSSIVKIDDGSIKYIPKNVQCYNIGGFTISRGAIICDGEIISAAALF